MGRLIWFNITDGFKMWGFDVFQDHNTNECKVIIYFGKIQRSLQGLRKFTRDFENYAKAYDYIMKKRKDKEASGYKPIKNHIYSDWAIEDKPVSELIQKIEGVC